MATTRSMGRESGGGSAILNAALLETFDGFKQKHVKQNREIIHKNAELLRIITDLNRTVRTIKADQLADAIRSKIKIVQLENDLRGAHNREQEWRRRAEGSGHGRVDALRSALSGIIEQLSGLEKGLGSTDSSVGSRSTAGSEPTGASHPSGPSQMRRCPSRAELQATRERRPSTLAAGGRPDLSLIAEGSGTDEDEDQWRMASKIRGGVLAGVAEDRSASPTPSPPSKAPVVHVDVSRRTGRRQSVSVPTAPSLPFPSAPSEDLPKSSSATSVSSIASSSSSSSLDIQHRLRPPSSNSGTETEREVPRRRPLSGIVVSNVSTRPGTRRLGRLMPTSETEAEGDIDETATESEDSETEVEAPNSGASLEITDTQGDDEEEDRNCDEDDEDWTLTSPAAFKARDRRDPADDEDLPRERVPTPVSPPVRRRTLKPSTKASENEHLGSPPRTARRVGATLSESRTGMQDITSRLTNTDEPLVHTPRTVKKSTRKLEAVVEETPGPSSQASSVDMDSAAASRRESRRARKSVNCAGENSKMRQPEGYVSSIKRIADKPKPLPKPRSSASTAHALGLNSATSPPKTVSRRTSTIATSGVRRATISSSKKAIMPSREELAASTSSNGSSTATSKPGSSGSGGGARPSTTVSALHRKVGGATPSTAPALGARGGGPVPVDAKLLREFEKAMEEHAARGDTSTESVVVANGRARRHSTAI